MVRVLLSVAALSMLLGVQAAPAAAKAAAKETTRATSASSDALVTFEGVKSIAYQTAHYWIDVAKYCRDTAVTMLPKDMQAKYSQAVRDGNKYYAQAKDVYFAEVAPKIDPVIEASAAGAEEVYGFVNEKQKSVTAAPFKKMHAAYPATRGIAGSELADRLVFIILSMTLLSWAVYLFKLPFRCLGYLLCPRRSKDVRSAAVSSKSEKAKAQQGKGSPAAPTKNFKGKKQN
ncbi:hypothetical protein FOZ63_008744 [Perkinsus olseni]|uniref:Uncharacterized protein n=1 Tax=Perkinsus olseni TaxID=32597 RepID=A0A7J6P3J0_PEROL|nr:hypothetical protein FOZ63_008744 [Perkinsus olseni]